MQQHDSPLTKPNFSAAGALFSMAEGSRAVSELVAFIATEKFVAPRQVGESKPVLVLPGFTAGDSSTRPLRRVLVERGYGAYGWQLGVNVGPTRKAIDGLGAQLTRIAEAHGQRVSVVGWSLGGLFGRDLAVRFPNHVDRLITLASPMDLVDDRQSRARAIYRWSARFHDPAYRLDAWTSQRAPESIPSTSIYSRSDGVIHWTTCLLPPSALWENVEVIGSHNGLGHNVLALRVVLDRLAVAADEWKPFHRPSKLRWCYPTTARQ